MESVTSSWKAYIPHSTPILLSVAGFTLLILDHFYTLDEELRLMWTAPRSLVKVLFLVVSDLLGPVRRMLKHSPP